MSKSFLLKTDSLWVKAISIVIIATLLVGCGLFVYYTGGIKYVFSHSMYIPIVLAAVIFRTKGGILAGLLGGLIVGPYMPIDTLTGELQLTVNWLFRLAAFCIIGGFVGFIVGNLGQNIINQEQLLSKAETLRLEAEAARKHYTNILARIKDGFVALDRNWYYTHVNVNAAKMLQREKSEDLIGKHIWTEYPEGVGQPFYKAYYQAFETQQPVYLEEHYEPWNRWFENRIYPSPDGLTIYFTEITERKLAEEKLKEWHDLMQHIIRHDPNAIAVHDHELKYIFVSERYIKDYRVIEDNVIGKHHYEVFPEIPQRWRDVHQRALKGEVISAEEDIFVRKDGTIDYTTWHCRPWHEKDGSIGGIILYTEVITARKKAELERNLLSDITLAISEADDFDAAMTAAISSVCAATGWVYGECWMPDPDLQALFCSSAWYTSTEELAGFRELSKNYNFPLGVGLPGKVWAAKEYVWIKDVTKDLELLRRNIAREARLTSAAGFPVLVGSEVIAVMVFFMYRPREEDKHFVKLGSEIALQLGELFKRKIAEEGLQKLNLELEQRINERTAQLEAKNRELETFTYSVSHDLKAPLRGIDGYSRLLLTDHAENLNQEGRAFLRSIRRSAGQMSRLIDDLLSYSRLEQRSWQQQAVNLQKLVSSILVEPVEEITARGGSVEIDLPQITIYADQDGLALALRNLLDNAAKYSSKTEAPAIRISCLEKENSIIIMISDNGIGFDMQYHDRIFGIFNRLHPEGEYSGTGIGLAMVKKALDRMGGRAWAESAPAKGSTFYLEIPLNNRDGESKD